MDLHQLFQYEFEEHNLVLAKTKEAIYEPFKILVDVAASSINDGGKILFFGNGGSAADAQHLSTELVIRYKRDRDPIPAIALTTDSSALTAAGNDIGFDSIFSRQIEALARPGDIAIGISTSGNSKNVFNGLSAAKSLGSVAAGFGGRDGGKIKKVADPYLVVPSNTTARIQEMHILIGHMLCDALEKKLNLV